ncbi:uncharacterized protein BT62DRAFT_1012520 [Guyanagaster necrorhizus]|uniref:Uncharacterized protein n=1 Tax=Guyanagaster necrorhizus TaxID=856835 RepID=A0A9P7VHR1_9AGAR|nr:uncharacterized protein BT62DRAFT_1012520 [Guyanagaster necrorhizus MCA 3950]KAG7440595.1 hypothetical protein BT62DRAFT_1012520 [Guyanagaster necrorhizus MCA 3950]
MREQEIDRNGLHSYKTESTKHCFVSKGKKVLPNYAKSSSHRLRNELGFAVLLPCIVFISAYGIAFIPANNTKIIQVLKIWTRDFVTRFTFSAMIQKRYKYPLPAGFTMAGLSIPR